MPTREATPRQTAVQEPAGTPPVARRPPPPRSGDGLPRPQSLDPLMLLPFGGGFSLLRTMSDVSRAAFMGATVAAMVSLSPFLWAPPIWVLALMTPKPSDEGETGRRDARSGTANDNRTARGS